MIKFFLNISKLIMGFFSNLMGHNLLGTITINFYDGYEASVEYKTKITNKNEKEEDLMLMFALYYAKTLYNLNRGLIANSLIRRIQETIEKIMNKKEFKRINILINSEKLVKSKMDEITKKYSGELYEKSNQKRYIQTHTNDMHDMHIYSPISVVIFLQFLINNFSREILTFLFFVLRQMHNYYKDIADYSDISSINEAPNYAINLVTKILNNE